MSSLASPNPYQRRGFLWRRSPSPSRKLDVDRCNLSAGFRPPLQTNATQGRNESSSVTSGGTSPSSAGRRPPFGKSEGSTRGCDENAYVVHPTFRHWFAERTTSNGADDWSRHAHGQNHQPDSDGSGEGSRNRGGSAARRPGTAVFFSRGDNMSHLNRRSERRGKPGSVLHGRGQMANVQVSTGGYSPLGRQRRNMITAGRDVPRVVVVPHAYSRQGGGGASFSPRTTRFGPNSDDAPGTHRNDHGHLSHETLGDELLHAGKEPMVQGHAPHEAAATIKGRVRDIQARERPRQHERGGRLSTTGRREADPRSRISAEFVGHSEQVLALVRYKDVLFSAAADGTAKAWDTYSQQCLATYAGHRKAVWGLQVTSRTLITGSADGTVRFWDIETAQPLHVIDLRTAVRDVVVVGDFLAVATSNPGIEIIELSCMRRHGTLEGHMLAVSALASLEGEHLLVSGSHDTFIRIWNPYARNCEAVLAGHGGTVGAICTISWPLQPIARGEGHGDAETNKEEALIVSGSGDTTVRVWGRADGGKREREWTCRVVLEGHRHGVWAVHGSSLSGAFATGGGDATVKVWAPRSNFGEVNVALVEEAEGVKLGEEYGQLQQLQQGWECVGGVRGAPGVVGAILINDQALVFGTSEALIATFPLRSCMPGR